MRSKSTAIKVTLRTKKVSGGKLSLYLDFYPAITDAETGKESRRQFLKMYLYEKAKHPADKLHNSETEALAKQIRQRRENELNKGEVYSVLERDILRKDKDEKRRGAIDFIGYFRKLADKRKGSNSDNWLSALKYLEQYSGGSQPFADVTEQWVAGFREFLGTAKSQKRKTTLSINTTVSYFNKVKAALKQAFKDGILSSDINSRIQSIQPEETHRQFLTVDELQRLVATDCAIPVIKAAALFSALTGLRHSDIQKLTWAEVGTMNGNQHFLQFRQKKTGGAETHPISENAFRLLGERGKPSEQVFAGLSYSAWHNRHLYTWLGAAGITRNITFHCFRHTYATLLLSNGANMATVSKMLGHKDIKTTQIYAKVVDQSKRDAAEMIKIEL